MRTLEMENILILLPPYIGKYSSRSDFISNLSRMRYDARFFLPEPRNVYRTTIRYGATRVQMKMVCVLVLSVTIYRKNLII